MPIEGVVFDRGASDIDGFLGDEGQPPESAFEPLLTFTDTSFTASFPVLDGELVGDGPRLRYDVIVAPIPLPAGLPLLLGALGLLAFARRRR